MTCPTCRSTTLVEIGLTLGARRLTMHSCPCCENRWWDEEGTKVALPRVIQLAPAR
ncbi:MAG: hypothetical protein LC713_02300 [Actinobacteria bacterium]|nr:hypothetical protein [Actinomycetota bacterium]